MADFDAAYKAIVIPRLRRMAALNGHWVSTGDMGFGEAVDQVIAEAHRLGAGYLQGDRLQGLQDWIMAAVLKAMDEADQIGDAIRADPVPHFAGIAAERPHLTWVLAAASPEFREHLRGNHAR